MPCRRATACSWHMTFKPLQSQIQLQMMNTAASFGDKLDCLWVSDLHSHADLSPFYQLQASLLDSADSRIWIDSNVDLADGPVHSLEIESQTDPGIYFNRISYQNLDEYEKSAPAWISRTRARRLVKTTLEADWNRDLLGSALVCQEPSVPAGNYPEAACHLTGPLWPSWRP